MKTITEFLSTKIKNSESFGKFPETFSSDDILEFLSDNFFKNYGDVNDGIGMTDIYDWFNSQTKPSYIFKSYGRNAEYWIRIFRGGTISKDNPIFTIQAEFTDGHWDIRWLGTETIDGYVRMINAKRQYDAERFLNEINSHFEWI